MLKMRFFMLKMHFFSCKSLYPCVCGVFIEMLPFVNGTPEHTSTDARTQCKQRASRTSCKCVFPTYPPRAGGQTHTENAITA